MTFLWPFIKFVLRAMLRSSAKKDKPSTAAPTGARQSSREGWLAHVGSAIDSAFAESKDHNPPHLEVDQLAETH